MISRKVLPCIVSLLLYLPVIAPAAIPPHAVAQLSASTPTLAPMLERVTPAVVNIATRGKVRVDDSPFARDPFFRFFFDLPNRPRFRETQSLGSGVIVDATNGYIITNNHVIAKADIIAVTLYDKQTLTAKLVGADPDTDIAVIQVNSGELDSGKLKSVPLGDSDRLRVGDFAVAIGNPFGLGQTVTSGIVSALGRSGLGIEGYEDFIQTDASINPGNSGGALVDLNGNLIGINTAIYSPNGSGNVGIGFAIPINMAKNIMDQLIQTGEVKRGRIGIITQDLTPELAKAFNIKLRQGAIVSEVLKDSPADKAGIKAGDIIVEMNGRDIENSESIRNVIGLLRSEQEISITAFRNSKKIGFETKATAVEKIKTNGDKISRLFEGAILSTTDPESSFAVLGTGIEIESVQEGSAAWRTGLRKDDVIVEVNRVPVATFDGLEKALEKSRKRLLLNLIRSGESILLLIQ